MSHPIENIMQSSMEHIKQLADVNTVIGAPIMAGEETMILPVTKVSLGMLVGGGEYNMGASKKNPEYGVSGVYPFAGTSTLGMSLTPLAFLAVQNDSVRVLPAKQDCSADRLIEMVPQIIETAERLVREYAPGKKNESSGRFSANAMNRKRFECGINRPDDEPFGREE
jgi:sporulation protein YtfJ